MQTNILNFVDYVQCGEILKPPPGNYQCPYILKCFQCQKIYLMFEAFMFHIEDDCKGFTTETQANYDVSKPKITEVHSEAENMKLSDDNVLSIKQEENYTSMEKRDPLIGVKSIRDLNSFDSNVNNAPNTEDENKISTGEDVYETDYVEISDNSDEEYDPTSDEEMESISDVSSGEEDEAYEIEAGAEQKGDLDTKLNLSNFLSKFLGTREYVIAFIEAYERQASLWCKNYPHLRTKEERENRFREIAIEFNEKHDFTITCTQVEYVTVYLCRKYREDLKYMHETEESKNTYTPSWFFENLNFLKPFIETNTNLDSHMPDLAPNQIREMLQIYKELPQLWNTHIVEHYCKNQIDAAKQDMLHALKTKLGIKITANIMENFIRTIQNSFRRVKVKKLNNKSNKDNSDMGAEDNNTLENYYEQMIFLKDHVGRFECPECKRPFYNSMYLKIHQNNVHGFVIPCCSQCKKPFKSVTAYTNHAKRHMEDMKYECKECAKKFIHSNELRIHMRNHTGVKPFCCEICGATFRHIQSFKTHHRRHIKNYLHTCEICGKGFYSKDRYNDHMNSHSNTRNEVCNVCGKAFITKKSLQQHVVIHEDVRRYSCKLCGKSFKQKTGVNQHMRTHGIASSDDKVCNKTE